MLQICNFFLLFCQSFIFLSQIWAFELKVELFLCYVYLTNLKKILWQNKNKVVV